MRVNATLPLFAPLLAVQLTLRTRTSAQICENTFGYLSTAGGGITTPGLVALAANWWAVLGAAVQSCLTTATSLFEIRAALVSDNSVPTGIYPIPGAAIGNSIAPPLPGEVAAVLLRTTTVKGQHGRGRFSLPSPSTAFTTPAVDPNIVNGLGSGFYNTFAGLLPNVLIGGGLTWLHPLLSRPVLPLTIVTRGAVVQNVYLNPLLGTVRRRKEGRGR